MPSTYEAFHKWLEGQSPKPGYDEANDFRRMLEQSRLDDIDKLRRHMASDMTVAGRYFDTEDEAKEHAALVLHVTGVHFKVEEVRYDDNLHATGC